MNNSSILFSTLLQSGWIFVDFGRFHSVDHEILICQLQNKLETSEFCFEMGFPQSGVSEDYACNVEFPRAQF